MKFNNNAGIKKTRQRREFLLTFSIVIGIIFNRVLIFIMYVCISLYSLPFTGFESLPESVQTNLSKSPRNPQVICPATWSLFPGGH